MSITIEKQTTTMKWYIVRAQSNRERSVSERIMKESEKGDLMNKVGRVVVPIEKSFFMKNGKKVIYLANLSAKPVSVSLTVSGQYKDLMNEKMMDLKTSQVLSMLPWQYYILSK